jgi:SAM-dependent methyltransferase
VRRVSAVLDGRAYYREPASPGAAARRADLLAVVEGAVRAGGGAEAGALLDALAAHVEAWREHIFAGVNPERPDSDGAWRAARWAALERTVGAGAVHVELGTWSAFPDERVAELIAGDRLADFVRLDVDLAHRPDIVADVTALPLRSGSVDRVASNSLVEHVSDPHAVIAESLRVLRPGGVMVVVMPFVIKQHGYPHDYVRLTPQFWERACMQAGFAQVTVDRDGSSGLFYTLHNAVKMTPADGAAPAAGAVRELHELAALLLGALVPVDRRLHAGGRDWLHSVSVVAVKPGEYTPARRPASTGRPPAERLLDLLADPVTKTPLVARGRQLVDEFSGTAYRVRDGVPVFTEPIAPTVAPSPFARVARAARRGSR